MLIVLNALPITTTPEVATLAPLLDMKQQSKLGCWRNGQPHIPIKHGKVNF
jgi:hypothetical protein